jgi:cytidyltransferase-like protein
METTKKIIFTNGCFDILHIGHISLLEHAKSLGDYLIVGINSEVIVTTTANHNYFAGNSINIYSNSYAAFNGIRTIASVLTPTSFTLRSFPLSAKSHLLSADPEFFNLMPLPSATYNSKG